MGTIDATVHADQAYVRLQIQVDPAVTQIEVGRVEPSGYVVLIRAGSVVDVSGGLAIVYDYEVPLDVDVYYRAAQITPATSTPEVAQSAVLTVPSGGYTWLKDPGIPERNQRLDEVESIASLTRAARAGIFHVIDRPHPLVIATRREGRQGDLVFHTKTSQQYSGMLSLLSRGSVLLLQTPPDYGWGSNYVHVGDAVEERVGVATDYTRRWTLPLTMVDRPEGLATLPAHVTWQQTVASYTAWQDLVDTQLLWYQIAEGG